jgi:hypothetical protein
VVLQEIEVSPTATTSNSAGRIFLIDVLPFKRALKFKAPAQLTGQVAERFVGAKL